MEVWGTVAIDGVHTVIIFPGGCTPVYSTMECAAYMGGSAEGKSSKTELNFGKCPSKTGSNVKKYFVIYIYQSHISLIFGSKKRNKFSILILTLVLLKL